jgi:hypothetical protein
VLLEVHYRLLWNGKRVASVEADILIGNISLLEDTLTPIPENGDRKWKEKVPSMQRFYEVSQFFSSTFTHLKVENITKIPNPGKIINEHGDTQTQKSGNPGYNEGKPLISALYELQEIKDKRAVI